MITNVAREESQIIQASISLVITTALFKREGMFPTQLVTHENLVRDEDQRWEDIKDDKSKRCKIKSNYIETKYAHHLIFTFTEIII